MAKMKPLSVSYERCHELLEICEPTDFEKESGLKNKVSRQGTKGKGSWAGCVRKKETRGKTRKDWMVQIDGKLYYAARIIYFMAHGVDPYPLEIDHKNRDSRDNRIDNLRLAKEPGVQGRNRGTRSDNESGVKGMRWHEEISKWRARITVENKQKHLGYYATLKEAAAARNAAVREYFPEEVWDANLINLDTIED